MEEDIKLKDLKEMISELVKSQKETDVKFKETDVKFKETDVKFKETDKRIKEAFDLFTSQWGKLIESLVEGDLLRLLNERGIYVRDTSLRRKGSHNGHNYEFDIIAHNGKEVVIVEVKTTLRVSHVKHFLKKLQSIKKWILEYENFKIYGAVAFLTAEEASDLFAEKNGLFMIKATGDSASIINKNDFVPYVF